MSGAMIGVVALVVVGVILVALIAIAIGIYNRLVTLKNRYVNGFAQIEVQLKRRYDLIPNLVETAKGYLKHERETLEAVIQARNQAASGLQTAAEDPTDRGAPQCLDHQPRRTSMTADARFPPRRPSRKATMSSSSAIRAPAATSRFFALSTCSVASPWMSVSFERMSSGVIFSAVLMRTLRSRSCEP